jgi:hypothetical protein
VHSVIDSSQLVIRDKKNGLSLTVAVNGTMRARLLAVAFNFFPSALIACSSHPAPLLEMRRCLAAIWLAGGARRRLCVF